jgi:hypothetical protein
MVIDVSLLNKTFPLRKSYFLSTKSLIFLLNLSLIIQNKIIQQLKLRTIHFSPPTT